MLLSHWKSRIKFLFKPIRMIWFCKKSGCWRMCRNRYCDHHKCRYMMCNSQTMFEYPYCFHHKCTISTCSQKCAPTHSYCYDHKCVIGECPNPVEMSPFDALMLSDLCTKHSQNSSLYIK